MYTERAEQRRLRALAQFEGEDVGAVEHARPEPFERAHVSQRERHRARVAAQVGARTGLIEVQPRPRRRVVAEGGACEVEGRERHAPTFERREQRLLPLGMFVQNDEIGGRRWDRFHRATLLQAKHGPRETLR